MMDVLAHQFPAFGDKDRLEIVGDYQSVHSFADAVYLGPKPFVVERITLLSATT
jgi:hypothetical protein